MAQYSKITVINQLQEHGFTSLLYKLGVANAAILNYANIYNYYDAQRKAEYTRAEAVKIAAAKFKITRQGVYKALKSMQEPCEIPDGVKRLCFTNTVPRK